MFGNFIWSIPYWALVVTAKIQTDGVGLVMGGFGGGVSVEVLESDSQCLGDDAIPFIPAVPGGNIEGWMSEYVDEKIFLCGLNNIQGTDCYDLTIGEGFWNYNYNSDIQQEYAASIVFNGEWVLLGGVDAQAEILDSVEKKVAGEETWELIEEWRMPRKLVNHCVVTKSDTEIMVFGGITPEIGYTDMISVLDTTTNTWTDLDVKLPYAVASFGCLTTEINGVEGALVTGGCIDGCIDHINDSLFYSFADGTLTELAPMQVNRMGHQMTHINGYPAVIGGYNDDLITSVEFYENGTWMFSEQGLEFGRWAFAMPSYLPMDLVTCGSN